MRVLIHSSHLNAGLHLPAPMQSAATVTSSSAPTTKPAAAFPLTATQPPTA